MLRKVLVVPPDPFRRMNIKFIKRHKIGQIIKIKIAISISALLGAIISQKLK